MGVKPTAHVLALWPLKTTTMMTEGESKWGAYHMCPGAAAYALVVCITRGLPGLRLLTRGGTQRLLQPYTGRGKGVHCMRPGAVALEDDYNDGGRQKQESKQGVYCTHPGAAVYALVVCITQGLPGLRLLTHGGTSNITATAMMAGGRESTASVLALQPSKTTMMTTKGESKKASGESTTRILALRHTLSLCVSHEDFPDCDC
ncbi:hypothetical protein RSOL_059960, partial [Rhizoctonia solani AG-3 Rhs1AP]